MSFSNRSFIPSIALLLLTVPIIPIDSLPLLRSTPAIAQTEDDQQAEADRLLQQGVQQLQTAQFPAALQSFEQALALYREMGDRAGEGVSLNGIGFVYDSLGQYPQALEYYQQALTIAQEIGDRSGEGTTLSNIGSVYDSLGQYPQALEYYQQALSIRLEVGDRSGEGTTLSNIGASFFLSGQFAEAEASLFAALEVQESLRASELSDSDKVALFETQIDNYEGLQQVLIAQNKIEPALEVAERGRARALVELLASRLAPDGIPDRLESLSIAEIRQVAQEQNATLVQYSVIHTGVGDPALYIWVIQPTGEIEFRSQPLDAEQLPGAVDVVLGENAIFRGGVDPVMSLVAETRSALGVGDRGAVIESTGGSPSADRLHQLHQLLIEPIADLLPVNERDRIIFIPHGGLFLVPFAALQDETGTYLIQHHTILTAPSIQVLRQTHDRQQQLGNLNLSSLSDQEVLIVGNPTPIPYLDFLPANQQLSPLPNAEREALDIAQNPFSTDALIGEQATETTIAQRMPAARIIHFATHGLLEYGIPEVSLVRDVPGAIVLTASEEDDGLLTSAEILQMQLKAELVVLSACDTGRGEIRGDGVIGLSRSLITAGVPSVLVSLWSVPDAPTADLMTEFYRQLQTNPDKAQALRQAMLITMQAHPEPIDWAAFTLIGEAE
ncbi:MAG: CHAT domain-containing protein [Cyanobacteria bacterium CRU_2_1]|nr:CHAT domain-containing protein [Cyanobacteria bacterium CRU_2_1]